MNRNADTMHYNDALGVLASCFAVASLSGLAVLLRSDRVLTARTLLSAVLYNGLAGLIIGLLWFNYFGGTNPYFVVGVSGLAGMGTVSLVDVSLHVLQALQSAIKPSGK